MFQPHVGPVSNYVPVSHGVLLLPRRLALLCFLTESNRH